MSSYITSPFVLEERRLQGIVQQCEHELNRALEKVLEQEQLIEHQKEELREKGIHYHEELSREEALYFHEQDLSKRKISEKRKQMREKLATIQIELDAFSGKYGSLETALMRQAQITDMLNNEAINVEFLEKLIQEHLKASELEMGKTLSDLSSQEMRQDAFISKTKRGEMGVSLKDENEEPNAVKNENASSPLDLFKTKLNRALLSSFAGRIPELQTLKRELDSQPDHTKIAFAVRNMKRMDEVLKRIDGLEKQEQSNRKERDTLIARYKAVCSLLGEEPEIGLLKDIRSILKLQQVFKEKYLAYQERKKKEYISDAVKTVLARHGIVFHEARERNGMQMQFSLENAHLNVSETDTDSIVMEVIGEYSGDTPTLNDIRKSTSTAEKFCSTFMDIEKELSVEFGIVLKKVTTLPPGEEHITMQKTANEHTSKKYHSRNKSMSV